MASTVTSSCQLSQEVTRLFPSSPSAYAAVLGFIEPEPKPKEKSPLRVRFAESDDETDLLVSEFSWNFLRVERIFAHFSVGNHS